MPLPSPGRKEHKAGQGEPGNRGETGGEARADPLGGTARRTRQIVGFGSGGQQKECIKLLQAASSSGSTGGGRRLRHFVWSLWNRWHLVNLFDLSRGLDGTLTDANPLPQGTRLF